MVIEFNTLVIPADANRSNYTMDAGLRKELFDHAMRYYDVPGRHYHDEQHVESMLKSMKKNFGCDTSDALFMAIVMHDAIYVPGNSPASEEASAHLVPSVYHAVTGNRISMELNDRVFQLIRWTLPATHVKDNSDRFTDNPDARILLDLDLTTLSNPDWSEFVDAQRRIDSEFQHLGTREERMQGSAKFLSSFVNKGFVYYTPQMEKHNFIAIQNLKAYIQAVSVHKEYDWDFLRARDPETLAGDYDRS